MLFPMANVSSKLKLYYKTSYRTTVTPFSLVTCQCLELDLSKTYFLKFENRWPLVVRKASLGVYD